MSDDTRIYRYVITHDGGMAPNPRGDFLSLATCKPIIRSVAREGDWVLGNRSSPANERVVWAGRISRVIEIGDYGREFAKREDALFERSTSGHLVRKKHFLSWYHPTADQQAKDARGRVLLFDWSACWYFGSDCRQLPDNLAHLAARGSGHRVNGVNYYDASHLEVWLKANGRSGRLAEPTDDWETEDTMGCGKPKKQVRKSGRSGTRGKGC